MNERPFEVLRDKDKHIARIVLDTGSRLNILTNSARYELSRAIEELGSESWMRVLVIETPPGKSFSAGVDINELAELSPWSTSSLSQPMSAPERIAQPVIAAIDGHCFGGPFEMSLSCDFRIVTPRASLGLPEAKLGQMPGSGGGQRLLRLVGMTRAKWMVMTGSTVDGKTAADWGLATSCVPEDVLEVEVSKLAQGLASMAPRALATIKRSLNLGQDSSLLTALEMEGNMYSTLKTTADYQEGILAWQEKRQPRFIGD